MSGHHSFDRRLWRHHSSRYSLNVCVPDDGFAQIMDTCPAIALSGPDLLKFIKVLVNQQSQRHDMIGCPGQPSAIGTHKLPGFFSIHIRFHFHKALRFSIQPCPASIPSLLINLYSFIAVEQKIPDSVARHKKSSLGLVGWARRRVTTPVEIAGYRQAIRLNTGLWYKKARLIDRARYCGTGLLHHFHQLKKQEKEDPPDHAHDAQLDQGGDYARGQLAR